jgi:hypothetical protein
MIDTKDGTLKALLRTAKGGDHTAALTALDRLEETGHGRLAAELQEALQVFERLLDDPRKVAVFVAEEVTKHFAALALHEALGRVDVDAITVVTADRGIYPKEQAALTRRLFKSLGLAGISVTTPVCLLAQGVDVKLPYRRDEVWDAGAASANQAACAKVEAILAVAFPNHDDRSDYMRDYYDFKWLIERR